MRERLFITGAGGLIGRVLKEGLGKEFPITGVDNRLRTLRGANKLVDIRWGPIVARAMRDHPVVIDLAGVSWDKAPWRAIFRNNLRGVHGVFEAARQAGVRRVIYASSAHVTGMYEKEEPYSRIISGDRTGLDASTLERITTRSPIRPDGFYGAGKAFGEALGRYYADEYEMSVICLRIGTVRGQDSPNTVRQLSTLLSHRDLVQLVRACIEAPETLRYAIFYGVSANTWRIWDIDDARDLIGYEPQDDFESWFGRI